MDISLKKDIDSKITDNARKVLEKRYLKKDEQGNSQESFLDLINRVATTLADADKLYNKKADTKKLADEFSAMMYNLEFLPNSPTLMNAGRDLGQLSACFVLPIEDSMESIFETIKDAALIHKSGGGTGFSFSRIRSRNSSVKSTGGIASGPISFLKVFDSATQAVKQGGTRRGANMGILRVDHPDIMDFISCKENDTAIANFNISVGLTEEFMRKVEKKQNFWTIDPRTEDQIEELSAEKVFNKITDMAYKNGEPGIVFLDRMNQDNPTPLQGEIEATNPCGEQPLLPYESCNLGSVNLAKMVKDNKINWDRLKQVVHLGVHLLDNVIDINKFPLEKIKQQTQKNRKIGLGVMGFADMLIDLGIAYDSDAGLQAAENVMKFILDESIKASEALAKERGTAPAYEESIYNKPGNPKLRNLTLTTIAPTGTLSIIADCSSGVEPLFALAYYRKVMDNDKLPEFNKQLERVSKEKGFYSDRLVKELAEKGSLKHISDVPAQIKKIFVTSHDISPEWHIKMQAAFQKYTNNAVSKTINFPEQATVEDIRKAYTLAYQTGCKGLTIYRDNSRKEQVLNLSSNKTEGIKVMPVKIGPRPRPKVVFGTTSKLSTGCGNLYVTINEDNKGRPFEVFMQMGKAGGCAMSQLEAIGRLVSLALRSEVDVKLIVEQLRGIRCPSPSWGQGGRILSCSDAIARAIEQKLSNVNDSDQAKEKSNEDFEDMQVALKKNSINISNIVGVCPDCGAALHHVEGCNVCRGCGYSKCG
ncbi:MAG: vitamin B12-dependent ribonucleotide reductase [Candidatus Omnitrophica bacterium]|nr:vitamin B12-dependent ribonucleotide reductase [Candidatus Omnitrophota bacterium]